MSVSPRCARPSAKRDAILEAARVVFLEVGYAAASMDNVAARAGVSKATIYAYFNGKDELFGAIIRNRCERTPPFALVDVGQDPRVTLTTLGRRLLDMLLQPDTLAMYRLVTAEAVRQPDLARAFYESGPGNGKMQIAQIFAEIAARGLLEVKDPVQMADLFVGMLRTDLFMRTLLGLPHPEGHTVDLTVAVAVETILRAYAPRCPDGNAG